MDSYGIIGWPLGHTMESGRPEKRLDNWSHKVVLPSGYSTAEKEEIRIEPGADCGCGGVGVVREVLVVDDFCPESGKRRTERGRIGLSDLVRSGSNGWGDNLVTGGKDGNAGAFHDLQGSGPNGSSHGGDAGIYPPFCRNQHITGSVIAPGLVDEPSG